MAQISLSDLLVELRRELSEAQQKAQDQSLKLKIKDIEVELLVQTTQEKEGKVGFKVWLLEGEAGASINREHSHRIKLRLEPSLADGGDLDVSGRRGP